MAEGLGGYYYPTDDDYIRQEVLNTNCDVTNLSSDEIKTINTGWVFKKKFNVKSGATALLGILENHLYAGNIIDYKINRTFDKQKNNYIYYVRLYCGILVDGYGLTGLSYDINANFTQNSDLTNMLVNLGYNVGAMEELKLDELIGMPIKAAIIHDKGYNKIIYIQRRFL